MQRLHQRERQHCRRARHDHPAHGARERGEREGAGGRKERDQPRADDEEHQHLREHRFGPEHAAHAGAHARGAPADHRERVVHRVAAEHQRRDDREVAIDRQPHELADAMAARRCAWRMRQLGHQRRRERRKAEERRLQPDDHAEPGDGDGLAGDERGEDEGGRPGAAYPAVLEARALRGAERQRIGEHRHRRERRRLHHADREEPPEAMRRQISERGERGERNAKDEHRAQRAKHIAQPARERRAHQAHRRAGAEHEAQLLRRNTARAHERRQERRRDAIRRVHGGIEEDEACQHKW